MLRYHVLYAAAAFVFLSQVSPAQVSTGTIVGVVEDASGAVVPNASVTAVQQETRDTRQTRANERGEYTIPYVRTGTYDVTAEAQGFKVERQTGIVLQVDQTVTLRFRLQVGAISEQVEVTAAAPLVDAATSSLGQVVSNKKIVDLPLNGRNTFALGLISGNTMPVTGMGTNLPFVAGGGRFAMNDVMLDGIDDNTSVNAGNVGRNGIAYTPSVDAVEEFKVKTSSFSAEFGRSAGAIISATTKSGTNDLHGNAWEFLRNQVLDANNFFSNAGGLRRQAFKQNQFGFTLGGPVVIPKVYHGRDKTFFFADYEGTRRRTSASSTILDIPPVPFRNGDFSSYAQPIYDPRARHVGPAGTVISTPFVNNIIPSSLLNPSSVAILGLLPSPNFGAAGAQSRNYIRIAPQPFDNDQFDTRIDHRISNSDTIFGRFSLANSTSPNPGNFDGFIGGGTTAIRNSRNAVLNETHIFTPNLVNSFRAGYTRQNGSSVPLNADVGVAFAQKNNVALFPFPVQDFPSIQFAYSGQISGTAEFSSIGGAAPNLSIENTFQAADDLSFTRGHHTFKAGVDIRRYRFDNIFGGGTLIFGSIFSSSSDKAGSGAPLADFLMGYPSNTDGKQLLDWARQRDIYAGSYFQDDWKISNKLTMNIGIRYDLYTQPVDARDRGGLFNIANGTMAIPGQNGFSRAIVKGDHNNWAPRLGFAYSVNQKLTVRTGAGIFFSRREQNQGVTEIAANIPNTPTVLFPAVSATATVNPPVTINSPLGVAQTDPTFSGITAANPVSYNTRTPNFNNVPDPYSAQWNFDVQYSLQKDTLLEVSYSGEKGTKLIVRQNLNQIPLQQGLAGFTAQANRPFPTINNSVGVDSAIGNNSYNALNVRFERRYTHGLIFLFNYTWSKNIESNGDGDSSYDQNGGTTLPLDSYNLWRERSYAPLDVPQIANFSFGYELPFGTGKHWLNRKGFVNAALGGWQVNGIATFRSGFPTDIRDSHVAAANQLNATYNLPDRLSGVSVYLPNRGVDGYFNPAAFMDPATVLNAKGSPIVLFGNSARRVGRGPTSRNADISLFKNFRPVERVNIQFRAEAFNLTNTPTFFLPAANSPALTLGTPSFGKLSSSSATGRQVQFGLKIAF